MTDQHPLTPPPELVREWRKQAPRLPDGGIAREDWLMARAYEAGADQELEACCEWLSLCGCNSIASALRTDRRPKAPSLKEQALAALSEIEDRHAGPTIQEELIRRALEQLDD